MATPGVLQSLEGSTDGAVPAEESEARRIHRRRSHLKSRRGCTACRRRRVKCDEERPRCGNCQRREEDCSLENLIPASRTKILRPQEPSLAAGPQHRLHSHVNMLQMKLLHHFNTVTAETLVFGVSIWRGHVMALALKHEFLMHAVLLIAAKHLCFLSLVTASNVDALIATSTLLVHYAWATDEGVIQAQDTSRAAISDLRLNLNMDPLFSLSQGLRTLFMKANHFIERGESIFATSARYRPRESLEQATIRHPKPSQDLEILISEAYCKHRATSGRPVVVYPESLFPGSVERFFLDLRTGHEEALPRQEGSGDDGGGDDAEEDLELIGFLDATSRLVLILGLFGQQSSSTGTRFPIEADLAPNPTQVSNAVDGTGGRHFPPLSDLARYIFAFPTRSTDTFIRLVQHHHPHALLVLSLFYRAVSILLPQQQCWWSQRRARVVGSAIECALRAQGDAHLDAILQEGRKVLDGGTAGISSCQNTEHNPQDLLRVDTWDATWKRTRCVLERFGWRKGRWYSEELALSSRST
ncbi:Fungal Zn2-Cys6 binuclear cluster domain-containing protein [Cladophialophora immunda]|nr:Fungal Zn2-Cys6 binuclear cluster domain-containing protein [Cladophialophora immunda]